MLALLLAGLLLRGRRLGALGAERVGRGGGRNADARSGKAGENPAWGESRRGPSERGRAGALESDA